MSFMAATYRLCNSALGQQLRRSASTGAVRSSYTVSYAVHVLPAMRGCGSVGCAIQVGLLPAAARDRG